MKRKRLRPVKVGGEASYGLVAVQPHSSRGVARSGRRHGGADVMLRYPGMTSASPVYAIGKLISDALDPVQAPSKVRTMADMTPEELAKLTPPRAKR